MKRQISDGTELANYRAEMKAITPESKFDEPFGLTKWYLGQQVPEPVGDDAHEPDANDPGADDGDNIPF